MSTRRTLSPDGSEWEEARSAPVGEVAPLPAVALAADLGIGKMELPWRVGRVDEGDGSILYEIWSADGYFLLNICDAIEPHAKAIVERIVASINGPDVPTPSPTGTELALDEAKRHIALLTSYFIDSTGWVDAANDARAFIAGVPIAKDSGPSNERSGATPNHGDTL